MSILFIDGRTKSGGDRRREVRRTYGRDSRGRFLRGFTAAGCRAAVDHAVYHPDNPKDYGCTVGIMDSDGNTYCVGCSWCDVSAPWTEYHTAVLEHDENTWPDRGAA